MTRLKSNTKAEVISVSLDIPEKLRKKIIGLDIQEAIEIIRSFKLDIDAKVAVRYFTSGKKKTKSTLNLRFIAVYNDETDDYHTFSKYF